MALFLFLENGCQRLCNTGVGSWHFQCVKAWHLWLKVGGGLTFSGLMRLAVIDKKTRALSFWRGQGLMEIDRLLTTKSTGAVIVVKNAI